jgi:hypothetical protein
MKSDSNEELNPSQPPRRKRFSKTQNLEFDFQSALQSQEEPTSSRRVFNVESSLPRRPDSLNDSDPKTSPQPQESNMPIEDQTAVKETPFSSRTIKENLKEGAPFSQFQQNVQRQSREQKAVGSLLSGVAITLIGGILLVAILAGFGGWILWSQIHKQSVTVAQLESRLSADIQETRKNLEETSSKLETVTVQTQAQKQQIVWLQSQIEELRAQRNKDRAISQTALQKLDVRLLEVERKVQSK